jgi:hypothetical protein
MKRIFWATAWVLPFLMVAGLGARVTLSKRDADRLQTKITRINANGQAKKPVSLRTAMSEAEVNSYLAYALAEELPAGVTDLYVTIEGDGRLSGQAIVDLNRVKAERSSGGWLDPLAYLGGKAPVTAVGALHTSGGTARLELESTTVSGVPVPKVLLQALVSHYTRTSENPDGISLDDTFKLPAGIREIQVGKGEAVVVQ